MTSRSLSMLVAALEVLRRWVGDLSREVGKEEGQK